MRRATPLALLTLLTLIVGCSSGDEPPPSSAPPPVPSTSATPSVSLSPTEEQLELQEAERVVRRVYELETYPLASGDFSQYPPELEGLLMGDYLTGSKASFETAKQAGWRVAPDAMAQVSVVPKPGLVYEDSTTALLVCLDTRNAPLLDSSGSVISEGGLWTMNHYFKRDQGKLKLFTARNEQKVSQCPTE